VQLFSGEASEIPEARLNCRLGILVLQDRTFIEGVAVVQVNLSSDQTCNKQDTILISGEARHDFERTPFIRLQILFPFSRIPVNSINEGVRYIGTDSITSFCIGFKMMPNINTSYISSSYRSNQSLCHRSSDTSR